MQNIFAYFHCRQSDYHLALDLIKKEFAPDLNSMEVQDPVKREEDRKVASALFARNFNKDSKAAEPQQASELQQNAARDAFEYFQKLSRKDMEHLRKSMVAEAEKIAERYLAFLLLITELAAYARNEREKRMSAGRRAFVDDTNWIQNRLVALLAGNKPLQLAAIKHNLHWKEEQDFVKQLYKEILGSDETFTAYLQKPSPDFEEDRKIVLYIVKKVLFKHELVNSFMEERDLYWAENQEVLKSMVLRTVKSLEEESTDQHELAELSYNWEDDKEFFIELFNLSIRHE